MSVSWSHKDLLAVACRAAAAAAAVVRDSAHPERYTGAVNTGGDRVLAVDEAADQAVQQVLADALGAAGLPYSVFSEESGLTDCGARYPLFVVDPVDGSAQARRRHPDCAASIAVAVGPVMADVVAGVVQPLLGGDPYTALRGQGAWLGERRLPLTPVPAGPATSLLIEGYDAVATAGLAARLAAHDPRCQLHCSGSIALQLALLGAGCYDALIVGRAGACTYDIAAGWLIAHEAGSALADLQGRETLHAPLTDITLPHHLAGARRPDLLETLLSVARTAG